jgi:predicted transcriptional regulator
MTDILQQVRDALHKKRGALREIARDSGVSYDTVLRIRDGETDPGFSKVAALHAVLFQKKSRSRSIPA